MEAGKVGESGGATRWLATLVLCAALTSVAANAAPDTSQETLQETTVTAQRRAQPLSEVSISLAVLEGRGITDRGWHDSQDLADQVPGLVARSFSGGGSTGLFAIRGVAQNDFNDHQEAPVAIYEDEVYQPFTGAAISSLFDLSRVEVLRGPQGTLFGRNATGGAIHLVSAAPTTEPMGRGALTIASFGERRLEVALSGPLGNALRARLAAVSATSDGYLRTAGDGTPRLTRLFGAHAGRERDGDGDLRNRDEQRARLTLAADLGADSGATYTGSFTRVGHVRNGYDTLPAPLGRIDEDSSDAFGSPIDPRPLHETPDLVGDVHRRSRTHALRAFTTLSAWDVQLIAARGWLEKGYSEDDDAGPFAIGAFATTQRGRHASFELRATGELAGGTATLGAFRLRREGDYVSSFVFPAVTGASGAAVADGFGVAYDAEYTLGGTSNALFGQWERPLSEALRAVAGVRWTLDSQRFRIRTRCVDDPQVDLAACANGGVSPGSLAAVGAPVLLRQRDHLVSGKLQLEYAAPAGPLFWLGASRGVKGGGFTAPLDGVQPVARLPFDPEVLHALEAGVRGRTAWGEYAASAFHYRYDDYQGFVIEGPTTVVGNFRARSFGAELESSARLPAGVDARLGVSLLRARVEDVPVSALRRADQDMTLAPAMTAMLGLSRRFAVPWGGSVAAGVDARRVGAMSFNTINGPLVRARAHVRVDAHVTLEVQVVGVPVLATFFGRNLTDADVLEYAFDLSGFFGNVLQVHGPPRVLGVTLAIEP